MVLRVSGDEAILASKIFRMYLKYAEAQGWSIAVVPDQASLVAVLRGENAFRDLQYESGVHRIQWVPPTEQEGRIFTSKVMVAVAAEGDESDGPSETIRTYNFPQNRVTDHRIALTLHGLDLVMDGKLDPIIHALTGRYGGENA
jgi:protein subunit release factor A